MQAGRNVEQMWVALVPEPRGPPGSKKRVPTLQPIAGRATAFADLIVVPNNTLNVTLQREVSLRSAG